MAWLKRSKRYPVKTMQIDEIQKKRLKGIINFIVVLIVALIGFIKVKHPFSYLIGVPICSWLAYLFSDAICTDLIFGEK